MLRLGPLLASLVSYVKLFHVMGNTLFSETTLLREAVTGLRKRLPRSWSLISETRPQLIPDSRIDGVIKMRASDGSEVLIIVEVKRALEARDVPRVAGQLRRLQSAVTEPSVALLVAPYIGGRARELLDDEGIGYADSTGNVHLQIDQPALFLQTTGAPSNPWKVTRQPLKSLRGTSSGRAIRAFVDFVPPYGIRELAERSQTPAPTLSRVADLLQREALLTREGTRGRVIQVDWRGAIRRWAEDYSVAMSNRSQSYVSPRGLKPLQQRLVTLASRYAVTGSFAASAINPITEPRSATIFVEDMEFAATQLDLRPVESGANVVLAEPYDPVVFERTRALKDIVYVCPSQLVVDLLTGQGRGPSEGEAVLQWMEGREAEWRV